ncbi:uncharacterized protein LOC124316235 isoform X2 [Daphnia pulicaria]|uniref:uncharacterized protein LOC124316235 isoform X2 n=1 Tax=Daphnia pulicaria TaxID=35523 RepID=UPI001EEBB866|nr:uncharacterized protein LOC124316235 isoform X2 [Daphnia pulicaria]
MSTVSLILCLALMLHVTSACDGPNEQQQLAASRQQSDEYFANAYGFTPETWSAFSYQPSNPYYAPEYSGHYEGRTSLNSLQPINENNPFNKYFANSNNVEVEQSQAENRFLLGGLGANLINTGIFNNRFTPANTWRPFSNFANRIPISYNPNFDNPLDTFDACTSPSGDAGICVPGSVCSLFGGRPSSSCVLGKVCCVNTISTCGGTVTLNNTYWQSPTTAVSASSTCAITLRLDTKYVEQLKKPICQIRLDFVSFTTAQPTAGTCVDTFQVSGTTTLAPVICGDNAGQHMYLDVPSSALTSTDIQLMFNFGAATTTRSWNIKIAMLPCGASYLAPTDCLQYFTSATGKVKSFNWQDVASTTTRQLNNQKYNICFRTELVSGSRATQMCVSICTVTNGGDAFYITTPAAVVTAATTFLTVVTTTAGATSQSNVGTTVSSTGNPAFVVATCLYDFLQIASGQDATTGVEADRFCGNQLNPARGADLLNPGLATSTQVCTSIRPFRMTFKTDGTEAAIAAVTPPTVPAVAGADAANTGFCLDYQEK